MSVAKQILSRLSGGEIHVPGLSGPARAMLALELLDEKRTPIWIAESRADAEALYKDLCFLSGTDEAHGAEAGLVLLAADDKSPYEETSPDPMVVMERLATLYRLAHEPASVRAVVVDPTALVKKVVPPGHFQRAMSYLVKGERLDRDRFLRGLVAAGFSAVSTVEDPGTYSVRGGIIDVYSPYSAWPIRIDLFGDEIDGLRSFDPSSQRTKEEREDAILLPAREIFLDQATVRAARAKIEALAEHVLVPSRKLSGMIDDLENQIFFFGIEQLLPIFHPEGLVEAATYLGGLSRPVLLIGDEEAIARGLDRIVDGAQVEHPAAVAHHRLVLPPDEWLADPESALAAALAGRERVRSPEVELGPGAAMPKVVMPLERLTTLRSEILRAATAGEGEVSGPIVERLRGWHQKGYATLFVASTRGQAERIKGLFAGKKLEVRIRTKPLDLAERRRAGGAVSGTLRDRSVHGWIVLGEISEGFVLPESHLAVVSEEELFGQKQKRSRRAGAGAFVSDLADLKPNDFVVHIDHGIGLYHGLTRLKINGVDGDFLHIEYRGGDKLYLPVYQLRLVQKYASAEDGRNPVLARLGAPAWSQTKKKVKDTLLSMAAELLRLHAMRHALEGFAFPTPNEAYERFEAEFAFEPTPDQERAIGDVLQDLQKPHPMDRLVCGDVGYGKTEVAMRAAMLAVQAGKQVAVLVPTTVLAAQHHQTFTQRMKGFGVRIGIVSRFQSNDEVKKALAEAKAGALDILIGTHRLLSKDVVFKDLGLLVLDEEQRFGVKHKEQLRRYRAKVHVLALSATPIPRTLHMGMMGVRDMSVIATPPVDRLAVKTEVHRFSEEVIREAILNELRRGGQCFVVHNRVSSIQAFAKFLGRLVPEARVIVGHGQMEEEALEDVMIRFLAKEYNVLVATTIIESGIDIPNANTILVNRADRLGLAQLYQLKGRVGRSSVRGFAHFLIPVGNLTPDARKRIGVLQRFTELGAGFKVATHDLEIRGAGNILGKEQSGQMNAVGFEMYQHLLGEAIEELKGAAQKALREPELNVPIAAQIPEAFVPPPGERLSYYQRFNRADSDEVVFDLLQELTDLYGPPPAEVENLALLMQLKHRLVRLGVLNYDYAAPTTAMPSRIVLRFDETARQIAPDAIVRFVKKVPAGRKLIPDGRLIVHLAPFSEAREILTQSKDLLGELIREGLERRASA